MFRSALHPEPLGVLIVSHNSLDAACCSGRCNPGKAVATLPWFLCSSWAPPTKPSPSFTCAHRARRRAAIPHRGPSKGGPPAGERAQVLDVPWSNAAMQARRAALGFIPPRGLGSLCLPSGYSRGGAVPCRASPDLPWQRLAAGVFCSQSQHACAE